MIFENIESELVKKQQEINEITDTIIALFDEEDFNKKVTPNGISFQKTLDQTYANFYIDEKLNYKSYITNNKSNYSSKGKIDNVIEGAKNFIDIYDQFLFE